MYSRPLFCVLILLSVVIYPLKGIDRIPDGPELPGATEFGARLIGTPCRIINAVGKKLIYQPPGMDYPILILNSCTTGRVGSAVFVDYVKGTSVVIPFPSGGGGWDIIEVEPGKLLFESLSPLSLVTIDVTGGQYKIVSSVSVPQAEYAWSFAKGTNGEIYFGSYPTGHVYRYNPKTLEVDDLGYVGPEGNLYVRNVAFDKKGYLVASVGVSRPAIVALNLATREQKVILSEGLVDFSNIDGKVYTVKDGIVQHFDSGSMAFVPAGFPASPDGSGWASISPNSVPGRLLLASRDGKWYEIRPGNEPRLVWNQDLRGGTVVGFTDDDRVITFKGQDYALSTDMSAPVSWRRITDKAIPVAMHFITADPKGGIIGGPTFGQTLFRFDPARNLEENTGQVVDGGGEVYDGKWLDGKFHFVSYAGGDQAVWDPDKEWDQWNNVNPKTLARYNTAEYGNMIRPGKNMVIGPGNRLYTGWSGAYGQTNGAVTEYDPSTAGSRHWSNQHFDDQASIGPVESDGLYVYGLTSNYFNGIVSEPKPVYFWVFDPKTEKTVFRKQLGTTGGEGIVHIPGTNRIWLADRTGVHLFNRSSGGFDQTIAWPKEVGRPSEIGSITARGSNGWLVVNNVVIKLEDGDEPKLVSQFKPDKPARSITAGYDGKLYFTQLHEIWAAPLK